MSNLTKKKKNPAAVQLGRKGGLSVSKNRQHMREIGKRGSDARWPKKVEKDKVNNK